MKYSRVTDTGSFRSCLPWTDLRRAEACGRPLLSWRGQVWNLYRSWQNSPGNRKLLFVLVYVFPKKDVISLLISDNFAIRRCGHLRNCLRNAQGEGLDGSDRTAVHLHTPVPAGCPGGEGERPSHARNPWQRRIRRRFLIVDVVWNFFAIVDFLCLVPFWHT